MCKRVAKSAAAGTARKTGKFTFEGASVVNGAQTVGCIGQAAEENLAAVQDARVSIRFISLENTPADLPTEVTRATNTQNRVERRDFVALDKEQERLRMELQLSHNKVYAIKTGEPDPPPAVGCTVVEATVALACAQPSSDLAVQAKREIGRLWEDVHRSPYKQLFNPGVSATELWRAVEILRTVDSTLQRERDAREGRERSVTVHGNRLVAHLVFHTIPNSWATADDSAFASMISSVPGETRRALAAVMGVIAADYAPNYLASLFKNASRCRDVATKASEPASH